MAWHFPALHQGLSNTALSNDAHGCQGAGLVLARRCDGDSESYTTLLGPLNSCTCSHYLHSCYDQLVKDQPAS